MREVPHLPGYPSPQTRRVGDGIFYRRLIPWLFVVLALVGCQYARFDEDGRVPVEIVVKTRLSHNPLFPGGSSWIRAQTVRADRIEVLYEYRHDERLIAHELCHVVQWHVHKDGFRTLYTKQILVYGYEHAPLEIACRRLEHDPFYRAWARDLIATID